ncbi:MAG: hypothetical protein HDT36_04275 [Clostridiales bacterium]|nr:hypothetical protein [Clostridiales bacterium]
MKGKFAESNTRSVGDYHLHTFASDGRTTVARHAAIAKKRGLCEIAIADHSFATMLCHMTERKFKAQKRQIGRLSSCGVKVLQGIEGNIVGHRLDVPQYAIRGCDVLIAGFHRYISPKFAGEDKKWIRVNGFGSSAAKEKIVYQNTEAYIAVMESYPIDVLAHIGHRAPIDFAAVCECAARHGVYIELNAKHLDALEGGIEEAIKSGVKFIVGSDAHDTKRTGKFNAVAEFIEKHSVPIDRVYGIDGRLPVFKDKRSWTHGNV